MTVLLLRKKRSWLNSFFQISVNRNGDAESDETDTAPGPLSPDVVGDNLDHSFNVYNTNNFMAMANQSTPRGLRNTFEQRHHTSRIVRFFFFLVNILDLWR